MDYVVIDLEATCWADETPPDRMEIIEIGAVYLYGESLEVRDEFASFVRPIHEAELSEFCRSLTSIEQSDVDAAPGFPAVLERFLTWLGAPVTMCSWGYYDWRQIHEDCRRHGVSFPDSLQHHLNLKLAFAKQYGGRACGMKRALRRLKLPLAGTHHRGIDDARNIAKIAQVILPRLRSSEWPGAEPAFGPEREQDGVT